MDLPSEFYDITDMDMEIVWYLYQDANIGS
jgi:hypothetical protein